jgi:uncharacterized protein involved in exopolysaccharide biosynthesis
MEKRISPLTYDHESETRNDPVSTEALSASVGIEPEDRLLHLAQLVWDARRFIARFAFTVALLTMLASFLVHNTYRSTTRLMPPEDQSTGKAALSMMAGMASKTVGLGGADVGLIGDVLGSHNTGAVFLGVLQSHTALEGVVDRFDLTSAYGNAWLHQRIQRDDACKQLEFNTETSQDRKSGIITISVTDRDPKRAAALADGYVDELNRLLASVSTSAAGREREFLEHRLVEVKKDLDDAIAQLSEFSSKNTTLDPQIQGRATVEAVATLEGELIAAESQLRGLQAIFAPENVRVRSLQARVAELRKKLASLSGNVPDDSSLSANDASTGDIPLPSLRQLPLLGAKYTDLYRRAKIEETVYQVLTQQYETAKVEEAKETPSARVLDRAEVPRRKWGPHRGILTMVGAVAGFLLACLVVVGTDLWKRWDVADPRKIFVSDIGAHLQNYKMLRWMRLSSLKLIDESHSTWQKWHDNGSK